MFIVKPSMWYSAVLVTCRSISRRSGQSTRWKLPSYISSRNSRSIALTTWGSYQTPHQSFRQWRRQWSCPMGCQRMCRRSIGFTFCSIARRCRNLRLSLKHMVAKICLSQKHVWFPRYWAGEWLVLFCLVGCSLVFFFPVVEAESPRLYHSWIDQAWRVRSRWRGALESTAQMVC